MTAVPAPLVFDDVSKRYGPLTAVDGVTAKIGAGERVALLGRNGAGKSTLLRMALGLTRPSDGSCRLFGLPAADHDARWSVGYAPQATAVPDRLRVREIITFVRDVKGAAEPEALIDRLQLKPLLNRPSGVLSLGQKRRLTLLLAFLGDPDLLVLDEPTVSLDSESRSAAWELIGEFTDAGGTLVLASHDFREVATLAHRVLVVSGGRLRADSGVSDLARSTGIVVLEVPRSDGIPLDGQSWDEVALVRHGTDRTSLLTRRPAAVLERLTPLAEAPVVQRSPTVEEVCLVLGGAR
ncbi:ABC-2 type transport system ATP-binding protein [Nocardiopsis sp. Huas11]|uniref:ABC transporter ATP-binding protein n=1 Tax=Nocardiopsis sp. Huas11 TaxID=2183912 RepID=UPI000EB58B5A|nr:ABC transporter ATP-binding protein [Nocardiopsis sp. Huas11]RKS09264.1 ABC-2 type transport system ATP-binding protein [Nocardiopsis sp. Huas11]